MPVERLGELLTEVFGHASFRPYQEAVCRAVVVGRDALLVMPTGAGKSLCYQLPGLARGGTTLVVSPLIALMEDQTAKMQALGLAAERIHSGRDRSASRQVCLDYLAGKLDYLFIAPERLSEVRNERRPGSKYAALENCRYEINEAEKMMRREGIRWMSSTTKSIEEIAATILQEIKLETR